MKTRKASTPSATPTLLRVSGRLNASAARSAQLPGNSPNRTNGTALETGLQGGNGLAAGPVEGGGGAAGGGGSETGVTEVGTGGGAAGGGGAGGAARARGGGARR